MILASFAKTTQKVVGLATLAQYKLLSIIHDHKFIKQVLKVTTYVVLGVLSFYPES